MTMPDLNWLGDLAEKVTAALGGTEQIPSADTSVWYRVRKTWADSKSQIGAYHSLANAKACADKNAGYSVFDESGKTLYPNVGAVPYMVCVSISDLNIRKGPGTNYARTQHILVGVYNGKP